MMWLRREMAKRDMDKMPAPSPIENNPVGWSSIYPPQVATNASPDFSPLADPGQFTNEQRLGAFWNLATRRAKPYTNRDLPQLSEAANEAYDAAGGFVGMSTPIRAYHGSPHTFDRFDMSKIGTGEGAQAYGHGLYFAGNEKVAKGYRDDLTRELGRTSVWRDATGKEFDLDKLRFLAESGDPAGFAASFLNQSGSVDDAIKYVMKYGPNAFVGGKAEYDATLKGLQQFKDAGLAKVPGGSMYEVSLRTSPERLLDWDKPLSQQPAGVREALSGALPAYDVKNWGGLPHAFANKTMIELPKGEVTGREAYILTRMGVNEENSRKAAAVASERLRDAGVPGIQYLDAGSRAAGDGSRNYVMFRDDIIDILKRYGLFGLGMVGGAAAGPYGADNP